MCNQNDKELKLSSEVFSMLNDQFNGVLNRTIGNMQMKGAEDATITMKLQLHLDKETRNTPAGIIDATIPKFKHDISSVMQVKDKVSGELVGDYQIIWDDDEKKYVMRKIDNGQTSMFDEDEPCGIWVDADYKEIPDDQCLPAGPGLPAPQEEPVNEEKPSEEADEETEDQEINNTDALDESTPFGWLAKYIGEDMRVCEASGNYTVRTKKNSIVLSSATKPDSPFFCPADKLKDHVQHDLSCVDYYFETEDSAKIVAISIECPECGESVFTLIAPGATEEEVQSAMSCESDSDYEYDKPED